MKKTSGDFTFMFHLRSQQFKTKGPLCMKNNYHLYGLGYISGMISEQQQNEIQEN